MTDSLNHHHIDAATRLSSSGGVLTVYAGVDLADPRLLKVELHAACRQLQPLDGAGADDLAQAIAHVTEQVERLLVGRSVSLRAIAGFLAVGTDEAVWCAVPERVATRVTLGERADVAPLLPLLEVYVNAGVMALSRGQIRVHDWSGGQLQLVETRDVEVSTEEWRDSDGPNNAAAVRGTSAYPGRGGDPVHSGVSRVSTHDAHDAKLEQHTHAAVADLGAGAVDELARQHGWSRLIWFGEPSLVSATQAAISQTGVQHLDGGDFQVTDEGNDQLQARVQAACVDAWSARSDRLLHDVTEGPATRRADGLQQVMEAAREGRVGRLLVRASAITDTLVDNARLDAAVTEVLRTGGDVNVIADESHNHADMDDPVLATLRW